MTLRARLTAYYTLFFALALVTLGLGLYLLMRQLLFESVVDELRVGSTLVLEAYRSGQDVITAPGEIDVIRLRPADIGEIEAPALYVQVADTRGAILARSANLDAGQLPLTPAAFQLALAG